MDLDELERKMHCMSASDSASDSENEDYDTEYFENLPPPETIDNNCVVECAPFQLVTTKKKLLPKPSKKTKYPKGDSASAFLNIMTNVKNKNSKSNKSKNRKLKSTYNYKSPFLNMSGQQLIPLMDCVIDQRVIDKLKNKLSENSSLVGFKSKPQLSQSNTASSINNLIDKVNLTEISNTVTYVDEHINQTYNDCSDTYNKLAVNYYRAEGKRTARGKKNKNKNRLQKTGQALDLCNNKVRYDIRNTDEEQVHNENFAACFVSKTTNTSYAQKLRSGITQNIVDEGNSKDSEYVSRIILSKGQKKARNLRIQEQLLNVDTEKCVSEKTNLCNLNTMIHKAGVKLVPVLCVDKFCTEENKNAPLKKGNITQIISHKSNENLFSTTSEDLTSKEANHTGVYKPMNETATINRKLSKKKQKKRSKTSVDVTPGVNKNELVSVATDTDDLSRFNVAMQMLSELDVSGFRSIIAAGEYRAT